ncbi:hypothetical protein FACS189490_11990 [Clostridia bacterium]|nr:hypothetical protein FACS189490_11990 [Clostridia bacterium]
MKYIIFGAGKYMREIIDEDKIKYISYFVDNNPTLQGTEYRGKPILSPAELDKEDKYQIFIIVAVDNSFYRYWEINIELKERGFTQGIHFDWIMRLRNYPQHALWTSTIGSEMWQNDEINWLCAYEPYEPTDRAKLVSKIINWDSVHTVLDLGAGLCPMKACIPDGVKYYPVDYKLNVPEMIICDFNKHEFPDIKSDVVICVGVNGYVDDFKWLADKAVHATNAGGQLVLGLFLSNSAYTGYDIIAQYGWQLKLLGFHQTNPNNAVFLFQKADF